MGVSQMRISRTLTRTLDSKRVLVADDIRSSSAVCQAR
jgi:hypothetical protein